MDLLSLVMLNIDQLRKEYLDSLKIHNYVHKGNLSLY